MEEAQVQSADSKDESESKQTKERKELEKRYPNIKQRSPANSQEGRDRGESKSQPVAPVKRLIQISCDETGRVNRPIEDEPYYHGFMSRTEASQLLKKDGEFLIRKADVANHVHYVLSVQSGRLHNFLIRKTNKKRLYWVYNYAFKTLSELVQYHLRNREPVGEGGTLITRPCFKQDWQLNNEQVEQRDKLGEGAFGEVWKGMLQHSVFHSRIEVAIKTLHSNTMNGDERIKFLKEANVMLPLQHENVIRFYGVCTSKEPIMIVMELATCSLSSKLTDTASPPTMGEKVNYVYGAAKGMAYLESKKIIHRDIAARNCLIGKNNEVKISDFGLSIMGIEVREKRMKNVPLRWLSPETLRKGHYNIKTDVYSFGVLIWEIYSGGKNPYHEIEDNKELRRLVLAQKIHLTPEGEISKEMEELYQRCMAFEPANRPTFEIIKELVGDPTELSKHSFAPSSTMPDVIKPSPPSLMSRIWRSICDRVAGRNRNNNIGVN